MQSLKNSKATNYYEGLKDDWKLWNKGQRQKSQPQLDFDSYCYNRNIDLSGKTLIKT